MHIQSGLSLGGALQVKRGDVVSFVGGGGKTTSLFGLAAELSAAGMRVITTTTTHISKDQVGFAPASVRVDNLASLSAKLDAHGQCLIIGEPDGKGRVFGATSDLIAALKARPDVDVILVEADGSRSLPFKAPGHHEPVVPETTTILVPVAGLNALGVPLDESHVHRADIAARLAQAPLGSPVTADTMARVLSHPEGGAKGLPEGARLVPLLNKADTEEIARQGNELAEKLMAHARVDAVLVGCLLRRPPILQAWTRVGGMIHAADPVLHADKVPEVQPGRSTGQEG